MSTRFDELTLSEELATAELQDAVNAHIAENQLSPHEVAGRLGLYADSVYLSLMHEKWDLKKAWRIATAIGFLVRLEIIDNGEMDLDEVEL